MEKVLEKTADVVIFFIYLMSEFVWRWQGGDQAQSFKYTWHRRNYGERRVETPNIFKGDISPVWAESNITVFQKFPLAWFLSLIWAKLPLRDSIQPPSHPYWASGSWSGDRDLKTWPPCLSENCCVHDDMYLPSDFDGNEIWGHGIVWLWEDRTEVCAHLFGALLLVVGCFSFFRHWDFCNQRPMCHSQLLLVISTEKSAKGLLGLEIGSFQRGLWSGKTEMSPRAVSENPLLSNQALRNAYGHHIYLCFRQSFLSN